MTTRDSFTLGQLLWTVSGGQTPSQPAIHQLRHLRQLGVPTSKKDRAPGSGNRLQYDYEDVVELGVAMFALKHGMKPFEIADYLVSHRAKLRPLYRKAIEDARVAGPDPGGNLIRDNEIYLRLHDRFTKTAGKFDSPRWDELEEAGDLLDPIERFPDGAIRHLLPLSKLVRRLVALTERAPPTRPGRK